MDKGYIIYAVVALLVIFVLICIINKMSEMATRDIFLAFMKAGVYTIVAVLSFVSLYEEKDQTKLFQWLTAAIYLAAVFEAIANGVVVFNYFKGEWDKKRASK